MSTYVIFQPSQTNTYTQQPADAGVAGGGELSPQAQGAINALIAGTAPGVDSVARNAAAAASLEVTSKLNSSDLPGQVASMIAGKLNTAALPTAVAPLIASKADTTAVAALLAPKMNTADLPTAVAPLIASKAETAAVNALLGQKLNTSDLAGQVTALTANKADTGSVNAALGQKLNTSDLGSAVAVLTASKAEATSVVAALAAKADVSSVVQAVEVAGGGFELRDPNGDPIVMSGSAQSVASFTAQPLTAADSIKNEREAAHFLRQAALGGGTLEEIARVVQLGSRSAWLLEQIRTPEAGRTHPAWTGVNETVAAPGWFGTVALRLAAPRTGVTPPTFADSGQRFTNRILMNAFLANATTSPNRRPGLYAPDETVRMKATWVLSKFIPCSIPGGAWDASDKSMQIAGWYGMLARHAFRNYADLLEEVTYAPAMARMLTYFGNGKFNGSAHPDENYAREVMQLFTLGLWELNIDGTQRLDSAGNPIPTYDQNDVREIAKVFTGLTHYDQSDAWYSNVNNSASARSGTTMYREPYEFYDGIPVGKFVGSTYQVTVPGVMMRLRHFLPIYETGAKSALAGRVNIPDGTEPRANIKMAIAALVNHPSCAPFVSKNLIKHMITSNPSPAYVARVAKIFEDDGTGVRGNLAAVWEAILLDPEASNTIYSSDRHGRVLDGFEIYSKNTRPLMRECGAPSPIAPGTNGAHNSVFFDQAHFPGANSGLINETDKQVEFIAWPMYSPSIFGFNSPEYTTAPAANWNLVVPEIGHIGSRAMMTIHANLLSEITSQEPSDASTDENTNRCIDYALFFPVTGTAAQLVERVNVLFCGGCLSPKRAEAMVAVLATMAIGTVAQQEARVTLALQMAAFSTEYWVM